MTNTNEQTNADQEMLAGAVLVTLAELQDLQHPINRRGDTRKGGHGLGKKVGMKALVDMGANSTVLDGDALDYNMYKEVMALGDDPSAPWADMSLSTTLLAPVNIKDPDNTAGTQWTVDNNATYVDGLITGTDAEATRQVEQVVVLKAGTYKIVGQVNRANSARATKLTITAATDGVVYANRFDDAIVSADNSEADEIEDQTFTLTTASQNVTFDAKFQTISNNAAAAGIGRLRFILESV